MENFEGLDLYKHDLKALTSQIMKDESLLRTKRRWLMDLPLSGNELKLIDEILPNTKKMLPESFIWEGDLFYEDVRMCIEKAFAVYSNGNRKPLLEEDLKTSILRNGFRDIFVLLDNMTEKGLSSFIELLTGRTTKIGRLSGNTMKAIEDFLSKLIADNRNDSRKKVKQLFQLLKDRRNFHSNELTHLDTNEEYNAATKSVINVLEDFPLRTLRVMKRKLQGVTGYVPSLHPPKSAGAFHKLIHGVKKLLMEMIDSIDVVQHKERLADALGVARLSLRLMNRPAVENFRRISSETEAMQNEIMKAITHMKDKTVVRLVELKKVQALVDPKSELSIRGLRMATRNLLTEYLLECKSLDEFPRYVIEAVEVINGNSRTPKCRKESVSKVRHICSKLNKDVMQKEIECVLTVSAQAIQAISDLLPEHELDEHFSLRYMDKFEGSDDLCTSDDDTDEIEGTSFGEAECIGETNPSILLSTPSTKDNESPLQSPSERSINTVPRAVNELHSTSTSELKSGDVESQSASTKCNGRSHSSVACKTELYDYPMEEIHNQGSTNNQYLDLQQGSSSTSMIAYRFIGLVLDRLANSQGLEISREDRLYLCASSVPEKYKGSRNASESSLSASKLQELWTSVAQP